MTEHTSIYELLECMDRINAERYEQATSTEPDLQYWEALTAHYDQMVALLLSTPPASALEATALLDRIAGTVAELTVLQTDLSAELANTIGHHISQVVIAVYGYLQKAAAAEADIIDITPVKH